MGALEPCLCSASLPAPQGPVISVLRFQRGGERPAGGFPLGGSASARAHPPALPEELLPAAQPSPVGAWGACPWGPASGHQSSPVGVSVLGQWAEGLTTKSRFSDLIGSLGNRVGVSAEERGVAFPRQKEQGLGFKSKLFPTSLRSAKPAS